MGWLTRRVDRSLANVFPEKRVLLQSRTGTSYLRLTPSSQLGLASAGIITAGWLAFSSAAFMLDVAGYEEEAPDGVPALDAAFEERLAALSAERDTRAAEALSAQARFREALDRMGDQQARILGILEEKHELEAAIEVLRTRLAEMTSQRDIARGEAESLRAQVADVTEDLVAGNESDLSKTLATVSAALSEAVRVRDNALAERDELAAALAEMEIRVATMNRRNEEMLAELEYAVQTSFAPLEGLFQAADLDLDSVLAEVRREHSGIGGGNVSMSTRSYAGDEITTRYDNLLVDLDRMNMLRIAANRIPFAMPVLDDHRFTSPFGNRRHPVLGGRRHHAGVDFAAPKGTPIHAAADGVVTASGRESGYGNVIRIQHDFGFETVYAHNSRNRVEVGQRVSRGDHIGDMGATGRVTGVHLHYEVRLNGAPVNPMTYLEAAKDVF